MVNGLVEVGRPKHGRDKTRITHLPRELLVEILLWLPGDSLLRCKAVRRSWNSVVNAVLKSRLFVTEHLKRSRTRPSLLVSADLGSHRSRRKIGKQFAAICADGVGFLDSSIERFGSAALKSFHGAYKRRYTCHCDGLVCIYNEDRRPEIVLVNPFLGRYKVYNCSFLFGRAKLPVRQCVGFGDDVIDDVYKLVRLVFTAGQASFAEIRAFGKGDLKRIGGGWRKIEVPTDYLWGGYPWHDQQVSCNGMYYWLADNYYLRPGNPILSFDFHSETFRPLALPASYYDYATTRCTLLVWRSDRVVLVKYYEARGKRTDDQQYPKPIELWVLQEEEEGCGWSWTKFLTIPPLDDVYRPLVFGNGDELILKSSSHSDNGDHLASYNVVTKTYRKLPGIPELEDTIYASRYVHSLVWFR